MKKAATLIVAAAVLSFALVLLTRPRQPEPVPEQPQIAERTVEPETAPQLAPRPIPEEPTAPEPARPQEAIPEVAVEPENGGFIEGYAYDEEGNGIPDVTVSASAQGKVVDAPAGIVPVGYITDQDAGSAETENSGRYRIEAPRGEIFSLAFKHADYQNAQLANVALGTTEANVVMRLRGSVSGVVLDAATRQPIQDFSIAVGIATTSPNMARFGPLTFAFQDAKRFHSETGEFAVKSHQSGIVALRATAAGYAPKQVSGLVVRSGEETSGVVILLVKGSVIRGWVVASPYSRSIAAANVILTEAGLRGNAETTTDADGMFVFQDLGAGEHSIRVKHSDYAPTTVAVTVDNAREHEVTIRLGSGGTIAGYVTENGTAASGADISVRDSEGSPHSTTSDERGYYEVAKLVPGRCSIEASLGPNEERASVEVWDGLTTQKDFEFWRGSSAIEGYVSLNGEPLGAGDATVSTFPLSGPLTQDPDDHRIGDEGYYRIEALLEDTYLVFAFIQEGNTILTRSASVRLGDGRIARADLDILAGTATITGTVRCQDTEGSEDVFLVVREASSPAPTPDMGILGFVAHAVAGSTCRPNEPYEIPLLPAGSYNVTAVCLQGDRVSPTDSRQTSQIVTVEEGQVVEVTFAL